MKKVNKHNEIVFIPVVSQNIKEVNHDGQHLYIKFHNTEVYQFYHVPKEVYDIFMQSVSKGKFFHNSIQKNYISRKLLTNSKAIDTE